MINYSEAVKQGVEAYIARKGMDEDFLRDEVVPCLKEIVKEKAIIGEIDVQFLIYSEAILVLSGSGSELETEMFHEEIEEKPATFIS